MLVERPFHDAVVMLYKEHCHVIDQVLDGAPANAAEEVPEILAIFFELAVDIDFRAAQETEHVAHIAKRQNAKFNRIFYVENGIANIIRGFHQVHERMANPDAVFNFWNTQNLCGFAIEFCFGAEQARRATVIRKSRVLDHRANRRIRKPHSAIEEVVFQLTQDAVALSVTVKVFEIRNFLVIELRHRSRTAILAEPFANSGFARMAKRRVSNIVSKACRLHDRTELVFVHVLRQMLFNQVIHRNRKATAHARNFKAVREAAMDVVIHRERMNLSLAA